MVEKISEKINNIFARTYEDLEISDEIIHIPPFRRSVLDNEIVEKGVLKLSKAGLIQYMPSDA